MSDSGILTSYTRSSVSSRLQKKRFFKSAGIDLSVSSLIGKPVLLDSIPTSIAVRRSGARSFDIVISAFLVILKG